MSAVINSPEQRNEVKIDEHQPLLGSLRAYPQRWLALAIFISHDITNEMMWITFSPITSIASCYYDISLFWINSLSWVYMLTFVVFLYPVTWFNERYGLRSTAIVGGCLNTIGAWIRYAGSGHNLFWILMFGQSIASFTYLLETNAATKLSAVWFPPNERTFATTMLAVISGEFGVLLGLLITPFVITGGEDTATVCNSSLAVDVTEMTSDRYDWLNTTENQFTYFFLGQAIFTSMTLPLTFCIREAPPTPPSTSAGNERDTKATSVLQSFLLAFKNVYFVAFVFTYGSIVAVSGSYTTVFQEVLYNGGYSHYQHLIGFLGSATTVTGATGLLITSRWVDYSRRYYSTAVIACCISTLCTFLLSILIQLNQPFVAVFIAATLTGGSHSLIGAVGLEFAVEMTYPLSEGVSASILNVFTMMFGIVMIVGVGQLVQHHLAIYGIYIFSGTLLIGTIAMAFIRPTLRRKHGETLYDGNTSIKNIQSNKTVDKLE